MSAVVRLAAAVARQVCDDESDEAEEMRSLATAARREYDWLRAEVQRLRDRLRRGEDIRPERVAEMLGDMLEEP